MPVVGSLALDRFRLEEELGSGAFGTVNRAWDVRLERNVAIKSIPVGSAGSDRVMREAHAAARLSHPGIVTLYEVGIQSGVAFLVTELVEGQDLRVALDEASLSDREVAEIGADLCEALDHAHSRGVVHRDLKPANVLISDHDGHAKLMDFGIARLTDEAGLTATGDVVGTLAYMSPEQAEGLEVGPATDVYSLCIVLYEAFTGENPNRRRTPAATVKAIGTRPPQLVTHRPDLPERLTDAIDAGLDPDPDLRPSLEQVGRALESSLRYLADRRLSRPAGLGVARGFEAAGRLGSAPLAALAAAGRLPGRPAVWAVTAAALAVALFAADAPGVAMAIAAIALPVALFVRGPAAIAFLPLAAPLLGWLGVVSLYPALSGLAERWRERIVLAASGFFLVLICQIAAGRELGLGSIASPPADWEAAPFGGLEALGAPLAAEPRLLGMLGVWIAAALAVGILTGPLRTWIESGRFFRRMDDDPAPVQPDSRTRSSRSR